MTRRLLILRHGKSDWSRGVLDFERPLKERGKRNAERIGIWMAEQSKVPDCVLSSPAVRALSTAISACRAMGQTEDLIYEDPRIYAASPGGLLEVLKGVPAHCQRVMLVGHNPGLEILLEYLTGGDIETPEDGKLLPTASLAELEMPDDWRGLEEGCATLREYVRPRTLPTRSIGSASGREDGRERPAYFYTQSSVIPYRETEGKIEILIVTSRSGKSWVVPKGVVDPGLTPGESALKEAREEAGIEGELEQQSVGFYDYPKWGGTCTVEVFPMRVTRELDEAQWEERHRRRAWVLPETAVGRLKQDELRVMVSELAKRLNA